MRWLILLVCGLTMFGQAHAREPLLPPLKPGEILRGRFTQERQLEGFSKPLRSEGNFVLVAGTGLIWRGEKPFPNETVITAAGILQTAGGTETMRLSSARLPFLNRFYDILSGSLSGDWGPVERDFEIATRREGSGWSVSLTPRNGDNPALGGLASIAIGGAEFVETVEIRKQGGDRDRILFQDQRRMTGGLSEEERQILDRAAQ